MILHYRAVAVAAIGWFSAGTLITAFVKIKKGGKVSVPEHYTTKHGIGAEVTWKIGERRPVNPIYVLALLGLSTAPLVTVGFPLNWPAIIILAVLSLLLIFLFGVILTLLARWVSTAGPPPRPGASMRPGP